MKFYILLFAGCLSLLPGCTGCSKSGRLNRQRVNTTLTPTAPQAAVPVEAAPANRPPSPGRVVIKMEKEGGVYKIPIQVNGVPMSFIFDTGASIISISATEAGFLYKQGKLQAEDFIGTSNFIDANGDVSEGAIINLKEVTIGDKTLYDVKASVVGNLTAPLLFGQSALEKFGKISIDYGNGEITFE